jgi:hypothetical protein
MFRDMISVYCEDQMKPINTLGKRQLFDFKGDATAVLSRVMKCAQIKHQIFPEGSQFN